MSVADGYGPVCEAAWYQEPRILIRGVPMHGSRDDPHECGLRRHDDALPHDCRACGRRERFRP